MFWFGPAKHIVIKLGLANTTEHENPAVYYLGYMNPKKYSKENIEALKKKHEDRMDSDSDKQNKSSKVGDNK